MLVYQRVNHFAIEKKTKTVEPLADPQRVIKDPAGASCQFSRDMGKHPSHRWESPRNLDLMVKSPDV